MHGWIILDKPLGLGSTQGVSAVKRALRTGGYVKAKVGHGGTLDPLATGVLPVAIGEATKLAGRMLDSDKVYEFTIGFGVETDTLDLEGKAVAESDMRPTIEQTIWMSFGSHRPLSAAAEIVIRLIRKLTAPRRGPAARKTVRSRRYL